MEVRGTSLLTALGNRLVREIERLGRSLLPLSQVARDIASRLRRRHRVEVIVPREVTCEPDVTRGAYSLVNLKWWWCRKCGHAEESWPQNRPTCPKCGHPLEQAFVYAPLPRAPINRPLSSCILPIKRSLRFYCRQLRRHKLVRRESKMRPLASIRYYCPDPARAKQFRGGRGCEYLDKSTGRCREGGLFVPSRGGLIRWAPTVLADDLTRPVSVSVYDYEPDQVCDVRFSSDLLPGIESIAFVRDVRVLQITLCVLVGAPWSWRGRRVPLPYYDDQGVLYLPARTIRTVGLLIKIKQEILSELRSNERRLRTLLHTLSHAFLSRVALASGLDESDFAEALWLDDGEVLIYDNALGGLGGVEGLIERGKLNDAYQVLVSDSVKCPLDCPRACKACLFSGACYMLNWDLDRHLLMEVMGWK